MAIYLIRHAQSYANARLGTVIYDNPDIPLTELGQEQAQNLIHQLPESPKIYVSEFIRTHLTAQPYCHHRNNSWTVLPELNEFSYLPFAEIQGKSYLEAGKMALDFWAKADPDWRYGRDSFNDLIARVKRFMALAKDFPDGTLCFGHGFWISVLIHLTRYPNQPIDMKTFLDWRHHYPVENASIHSFDLKGF